MPIAQTRLRDLVEESERNLARMAHLATLIDDICASTHIGDADKLAAITANAREYLCARDYTFTLLERERIKMNWRRNERSANKVRRLRERRKQGLADLHPSIPRGPQTPRMTRPETYSLQPVTIAQSTQHVAATLTPNAPSEPDALERELARARELGEQERARNAERLARSATDMFPETGG